MSRSGDQERVTMSPDNVMQATLEFEGTLTGAEAQAPAYEVPPDVAEHTMPGLPDWGDHDGYDTWRREHDERWEHGGWQAAAREYFSAPICPPPPA